MSMPAITKVITQITDIPDHQSMNQAEFDLVATAFAGQIKAMASDLGVWAQQANALTQAVNLLLGLEGGGSILNLIRSPGDILYTARKSAPPGTLICDGTLVKRTDYPDLFKVLITDQGFTAQAVTLSAGTPAKFTKTGHGFNGGERIRLSTSGALPSPFTTTTDYFAFPLNANEFHLSSGEAGTTLIAASTAGSGNHTYLQSLYGIGNGSTTFKLPDLRDDFIRCWDPSSDRQAGTFQLSRNRRHTHVCQGTAGSVVMTPPTGKTELTTTGPTPLNQTHTHIIADEGGDDARPNNRALLACIVY